jgi:HK97 family phage portal protein
MFGIRQWWTREASSSRAINCTTTSINPEEQRASLAEPDAILFDIFRASGTTESAVPVNPLSATSSPTVRACVEALSETVGSFPLLLYRKDDAGARQVAEDHNIFNLLNDAANPWQSAASLREQLTRDALLHGDGFAVVVRDGTGAPKELIRLRPGQVTVNLDVTTNEPVLRLNGQLLDIRNVLWIQAPSVDGIRGSSPVSLCKEAIGLNLALQRHVARLFGKGARPSGLLKFPGKLGSDTAKRIKTSWQSAHAGERSGGTAVLEEGGDWQALQLSSVDAQCLELWQFSVSEICRVFRVPPTLVYEYGRATWGNSADMASNFLKYTLSRWMQQWESEVRMKLLTPSERRSYYARFDTDELLKSDLPARADAYQKMIASRVICPNEARAWEDLPPYEGGNTFENPNVSSGPAGSPQEADPADDTQPGDNDPIDDAQGQKRAKRGISRWLS